MKKDALITGLIVGLVVPFVSLALLMELNDLLIGSEIEIRPGNNFSGLSLRFMSLVALCLNIFPFRFYSKRRYDQSMRGMIFPTLGFAVTWLVIFGKTLL
ncbi:MAG: hypothetical protein AAF598_08970 [Bacteroidota bacterium]